MHENQDTKTIHSMLDEFMQWISSKIKSKFFLLKERSGNFFFSKRDFMFILGEYIKKLKDENKDTTFVELHKQDIIDHAWNFFHFDKKQDILCYFSDTKKHAVKLGNAAIHENQDITKEELKKFAMRIPLYYEFDPRDPEGKWVNVVIDRAFSMIEHYRKK